MTEFTFREEALAAKARLDQLPTAMQVTDGMTRVTLIGIAGALVFSALASAFVVVPIDVSGNGVLMDRSGELLVPVVASAEGFVEAIVAQPGERVAAGQPVARLRLPELASAIDKSARTIASLEHELEARDILERTEILSASKLYEQKRTNTERRLEDLKHRLGLLNDREAAAVKLQSAGNSTMPRVLEAKIAVQEASEQIAAARAELQNLATQQVEERGRRRRDRVERLVRLDQARSEMAATQLSKLARETLLSPVDGIVAEIDASQGSLVHNGQGILNLVSSDVSGHDPLSAVIYVPLSAGKQLKPGAKVLLTPASHVDNSHDRLRGRVVEVSQTPVTQAALKRSLGNEQLATLATKDGPAFSVRVELELDPHSPSGYAWTSGRGPDIQLTRGTPLTAKLTVERATLLSLAMPALKKLVLGSEQNGWAVHK